MPEKLPTLYELCLERTAWFLKKSYWNEEFLLLQNPFLFLPSFIIDALIIYVVRISTSGSLLSSHLRPLSTSGRVRQFTLQGESGRKIIVNCANLQRILLDLSSSCRYLTAVKINISLSDSRDSHTVTSALNWLLSEAHNIKYVESSIKFDLAVLCSSFRLEKLVLNFSVQNHLCDFLKYYGHFRPYNSLKYIHLFHETEISDSDIALILQYCTELVSFNCDLSKGLEHLHAEELRSGSLTHKYNLEKCCLGGSVSSPFVSRDILLIASLTCPFLRELTVYLKDENAVPVLNDFQNLTKLSVKCTGLKRSIPYSRMRSVLGKSQVGLKLKSLELNGFTKVDLSSVGLCCPKLEELYISGCSVGEYSPTPFAKLRSLGLFYFRDGDVEEGTLIRILSDATNLNYLCMIPAGKLTDGVLEAVLRKNGLANLKHIVVSLCGLSARGWRIVARSLIALESVFSWGKFAAGESTKILDVFREINPRVVVNNIRRYSR